MNFKSLGNILDLGIGILFLGFSLFLTVKIVQITSGKLTLAYISLIIFYWLSYLFLSTALIRIQYRNSEKGIDILIDDVEKNLTLKNSKNGKTDIINNGLIKTVELYYSWNTNPFSSDLGYSKITLKNNSNIFITQNKVNQSEIKSLFRKKVTKEKSRFMNRMK
ncbi:hypothetical protein [Tenacibaculum sp. 1_MG-2023]|uniref:hypothetical protein n=1 Tax=Tenacibaculum sp. 1_MG-2023 TaxID=3062653 RepID=UPI0026E26E55|nr:hypothetical protein [Tenacibaculum sp. 1_MG-2023]MDO6600007.1 hypothetical protein [Tenacibaculum sp. 1_MG-2023]